MTVVDNRLLKFLGDGEVRAGVLRVASNCQA